MFTGNTRDRKSKSSNETKGNNPIIPIMWSSCIDLFKKLNKKKRLEDWSRFLRLKTKTNATHKSELGCGSKNHKNDLGCNWEKLNMDSLLEDVKMVILFWVIWICGYVGEHHFWRYWSIQEWKVMTWSRYFQMILYESYLDQGFST